MDVYWGQQKGYFRMEITIRIVMESDQSPVVTVHETPTQTTEERVIEALQKRNGVTARELYRRLHMPAGKVLPALDSLADKGHIGQWEDKGQIRWSLI
jgi:DNA-binding MarR family transcriptional regulator